jgi:hypothetical protein
VYEGQWEFGEKSGVGQEISPAGKYNGNWLGGKRNGVGVSIDKKGEIYQGSFVDDLPHGEGTLTRGSGGDV